MATTVQSIVDRVRTILVDPAAIRWSDDELVLWVNDAQRQIVLLKPDALATTAVLTLVDGTLQTLPAEANRLLRAVRNMSAASDGTGGRPVRVVDREALDAQNPNWHNPVITGFAAHGTTVKNYIYDEQDPLAFYVFPGVSGSAFLEVVYAKTPAAVAISGSISLSDIYSPSITDYILYRAYQKEAEAATMASSAMHYEKFLEGIGAKINSDMNTSPNTRRTGSSYGARQNG